MNDDQKQAEPRECQGNPVDELKLALQKKREESAELERSSKRCEALIAELNTGVDEIQQNIDAFAQERPSLRNQWHKAIGDWRCDWEAIRKALHCDEGQNCVQIKQCVAEVDDRTKEITNDLCALRAELGGKLAGELLQAEQQAMLAKEAYSRLLVNSLRARIKEVLDRVAEACKHNTGELEDRAKVYLLLESARELIAGSETLVTVCVDADQADPDQDHCNHNQPAVFEIPATREQYERQLVLAFCDYQHKSTKAALARDALAVATARREELEAVIRQRLSERKQNLLAAAEVCELAADPDCGPAAHDHERAGALR